MKYCQRPSINVKKKPPEVYTIFILNSYSIRYRDGTALNTNNSRYEGGNPEQTALLLKNASRDDMGNYTCELANNIGSVMSENDVNVDIQCKN